MRRHEPLLCYRSVGYPRYLADRSVAATSINVETLNGTVQLSGFAKSQAEKEKAAEIARGAKGVRSVRNDIIVRP